MERERKKSLLVKVGHAHGIVKLTRNGHGFLVIDKSMTVQVHPPETVAEIMGNASIELRRGTHCDDLIVIFDKVGNRVRVNGLVAVSEPRDRAGAYEEINPRPHSHDVLCGPSDAVHHISIVRGDRVLKLTLKYSWGYPVGSTVPINKRG